ncbi:MAG: hypothetical protein NVSMB48_13290 [Marmoricola sp.]
MPGPVLTMASTVMCAHGGVATPAMGSPRAMAAGTPAITLTSPYVVAGCGLTGSPAPPCVTGQWIVGAVRVTSAGQPLALLSGTSLAMPSGVPMLPVVAQPRVIAS